LIAKVVVFLGVHRMIPDGRKANADGIPQNNDQRTASSSPNNITVSVHGLEMRKVGSMNRYVALQQYQHDLEENIECCDEHTPHTARPLRTESCLHGNSHKLDAHDSEALLSCAVFEDGVEVCH
jgi:hypothetical protein